MIQLFATQEEIVNLLDLYLEESKKGTFEAIAVVAYTQDQNLKNALLKEGVNASGFLGALRILQAELEQEMLALEQQIRQEEASLAVMTNSVDDSNPQ